jgi:hypothetical protein
VKRIAVIAVACWLLLTPAYVLAGGGLPAEKTVRPAVVRVAQQIEADLGFDCHVGIAEDAERMVARIVCDKQKGTRQ